MWKITLFVSIIIAISLNSAYASSNYHTAPKTFHIAESPYVNQVSVVSAVNFWKSYGFNLEEKSQNADVNLKFVNDCFQDYAGYYDQNNRLIIICSSYGHEAFSTPVESKILEHELGHFLGFTHTSPMPIMQYHALVI